MLDRIKQALFPARRPPSLAPLPPLAPDCDRACPCCGAADAIKIDPLLARDGRRPIYFSIHRPRLCAECSALVLVNSAGDARPAQEDEPRLFRRWFPAEWRAVAACQAEYQRRQVMEIRRVDGRRNTGKEKSK